MNATYQFTSSTLRASAVRLAAAAHDVLVRPLVAAGDVAAGGLAPRGLRTRHTGRLAAFPTPMRMIARGHGVAAHRRADAQVAFAAGLAQLDVAVVQVADLADRGIACLQDQAHLPGGQADLGVFALLRQELRRPSRGPDHLPAPALLQLDIVNHGADRDVRERQTVAGADLRLGA